MISVTDYQDPQPTQKQVDQGSFGKKMTYPIKNSILKEMGNKSLDSKRSNTSTLNVEYQSVPQMNYVDQNQSRQITINGQEDNFIETISPRFTIQTPTVVAQAYNQLDNSGMASNSRRESKEPIHVFSNTITIGCDHCQKPEPVDTLIIPCACNRQFHSTCLKQQIQDKKTGSKFDSQAFKCQNCKNTYKILRIEKSSWALLKNQQKKVFKTSLILLLIIGFMIGISVWLIGLSQDGTNNTGLIVFSLMILFLVAMIFSSYLILELIRFATQVTWTLADRSHHSTNLIQPEYLNIFIEEGMIESSPPQQ